MHLYRNGSGPTNRAPEENFTGEVHISGYFQRETPSRLAGAAATFTPGDHAMTYVAIYEKTVEFREKVADEEYQKGP